MARNLTGLVDARQFVQITSPVSRPRLHLPRAGQVRRSDNGPVRPGAAFAAPLGADREERLLLLFAGLLDKFNFLREFALGGVRDFVLRAKILRDAVAQNDAALAAEGGAWVEAQRRADGQARSLDARRWMTPWRRPNSCAAAMPIWTGSCAS